MTSATPKPRAGEHTPGPWRIGYSDGSGSGENGEGFYIVSPNAYPVVRGGMDDWGIPKGIELEANARRIVACVNFLEGITIKKLESNWVTIFDSAREHDAMTAELAALREQVAFLERFADAPDMETGKTTRDLLRERERELVEALGNAEALRPRLLKDFGYVPEYVLDFCNRARALAKHGR